MINHYYYGRILKHHVMMFANIFVGLKVSSGKDACGEDELIDVPISYASKDRVTSSIGAGFTQNKLFTLPAMAIYLRGIDLAPDRLKGLYRHEKIKFLPSGAVFPDDVRVVKRYMPVPYDLDMELSIYASNTDQAYQMIEQILILFNYDIQLQRNDSPFDWTKIYRAELTSINNEEQVPLGTDAKRMIMWTLNFKVGAYMTLPLEIRDEIIREIHLRTGNLNQIQLNEYDENGNPQPFIDPSDIWSESVIKEINGNVVVAPPDTTNNEDEI